MALTTMSQEPRLYEELKLISMIVLVPLPGSRRRRGPPRGGGGAHFMEQPSDLQVLVKEDKVARFQKKEGGEMGCFTEQPSDLQVLIEEDQIASAVNRGPAHGADHNVPGAQAV